MVTQSYGARRRQKLHDHHGEGKDPYCDPQQERVLNLPHYHAFMLLGKERLFASHLTQLFCEVHMYQFIVRSRYRNRHGRPLSRNARRIQATVIF